MADLFTWKPNWVDKLRESILDQRDAKTIGRSGAQTITGYKDSIRLHQEATFQLDRASMAELMTFWRARKGAWESFIAPSMLKPGTATAAAPHDFNDLATVGLMRFSADKVTVKWLNGNLAQVSLGFTQDIRGTASGAYVYLYHFHCEDPLAERPDEYLTEWYAPVIFGDQTWTPKRIRHNEVTEDVQVNKEKCQLELDVRDSALIRALVCRQLEGFVSCDIIELDMGTSVSRTYFSGRVGVIERQGLVVQPTLQLWGGMAARQCPTMSKSRTCPHAVFNAACARLRPTAMASANWASTGTYTTTWGDGKLIITATQIEPKASAYFSAYPNSAQATDHIINWGYWAGGWAVTGSGSNRQVRPLTMSAYDIHNVISCIPLWPFRTGTGWLEVGDTVSVYPGCDGTMKMCSEKFTNGDAFGGQPNTPAYIEEASTSAATSGK